jgi:hypothetical protein
MPTGARGESAKVTQSHTISARTTAGNGLRSHKGHTVAGVCTAGGTGMFGDVKELR